MRRQEVELSAEGGANPVQRAVAPRREVGERLLELCRAAGEYGGKEAAFGMEVVKQQLLVHAGPPRDLIHTRAVEPPMRELFAGCGDDPQCAGITEFRLQIRISSTRRLMNK